MKKIVIIGAGLGGLSVACRLAKQGHSVTVFEKNEAAGGKVNHSGGDGFSFDTGASLVTMKHVFEDLFLYCGRDITDFLTFERLDPICRYFWNDGTIFDAAAEHSRAIEEVEKVFPDEVSGFEAYLADSKSKYEVAERTFLAKSLNDLPSLLTPSNLKDLFKISTFKTLDRHNSKYFKSPKLRQLFNRFATYNGSSPFQTPATFALIPHVEFGLGAWYPKGGIYEIPKAVEKLAVELGVQFRFGECVSEIVVEHGVASGIKLGSGSTLEAEVVVSNADAIATYRDLIPSESRRIYSDKKLSNIEPSCSGFVLLLGCNKKFEKLAHHNIFFSDDYAAEFDAIFNTATMPEDPSIYVCATSRTDPTPAPQGSENLFVMVNAPALSRRGDAGTGRRGDAETRERGDTETRGRGDTGTRGRGDTVTRRRGEESSDLELQTSDLNTQSYADMVISKLEDFGLEGIRDSIVYRETITPADFEERYNANKGSIYGVSSNGIMSAFMRIPNKAKDVENLYFVGGATHPGGGMPLVLLSGKMAAEMIG